jgi:hypothetical protein
LLPLIWTTFMPSAAMGGQAQGFKNPVSFQILETKFSTPQAGLSGLSAMEPLE